MKWAIQSRDRIHWDELYAIRFSSSKSHLAICKQKAMNINSLTDISISRCARAKSWGMWPLEGWTQITNDTSFDVTTQRAYHFRCPSFSSQSNSSPSNAEQRARHSLSCRRHPNQFNSIQSETIQFHSSSLHLSLLLSASPHSSQLYIVVMALFCLVLSCFTVPCLALFHLALLYFAFLIRTPQHQQQQQQQQHRIAYNWSLINMRSCYSRFAFII